MPLYDVDVEGVTYEVTAPDENTAWQWANYTHRQRRAARPAAPKESTVGSEFVRGAKQLVSSARTGLGSLVSPEEAARAGVERGEKIAAEAGEGPSFAAVRKAYEERGLLPAAGEVVSQIPRALAGQAPQLAAMAGGARLGAMAGAGIGSVVPVVGTGLGAIAGGVLGAGATLLPQFMGANVERQAREQLARDEPVNIDRTSAYAAAAGQAGIEAAGTAFVLGKRLVKGVLGVTDDAALATAKAQAELAKTAQRSLMASAGRGALRGTAEIPVEVAQTIIERAQAGLDLTSPEAMTEYGEATYQAALVGPTLGGVAGPLERSGARKEVARQEQEEAQKQQAEQRKAEEEAKKQPEYIEGLYKTYQDLLAQKNALDAQIKKGTKEAPLTQEDKDANAVIQRQLDELKKPLKEAQQAFIGAGGPQAYKQIAEQRRLEAMSPDEYQDYLYQQRLGKTKPRAAAPEAEERLAPEFADLLEVFGKGPSPEVQQYVTRQAAAARGMDQGDFELNDYALFLLQDPVMAQRVVAERPAIPGFSQEESDALLDGLKLKLQELAGEMGAGREAASAERAQGLAAMLEEQQRKTQQETQRQQLELEGTAERQAMQELAASRAADMRVRALQPTLTAPQLTMFPEPGERVERATEGPAISGQQMLLRERIGELERQLAAAQSTRNPAARSAELNTQIADLKRQLEGLDVKATTTARVAMPFEKPQAEMRPQGSLAERLNVLAERVLAAPRVDEETKGLVRQVQDNLPLLLQRDPQSTGAWLYRTLQGTAPADLTQSVRDRLAELEAGKRSETEQVTQYAGRALTPAEQQAVTGTSLEGRQGVMTREPTGEVRRAVQTEIEMPEPTATAFADWQQFVDYLASDGLQALRLSVGQVFPTLANLQKKLAPLQARVAELRTQLDTLISQRKAVLSADAAERADAEALQREAREALQRKIKELESLARVQYVGKNLREVDLIEMERDARQRVEEAAAKTTELRAQFADALQKLDGRGALLETAKAFFDADAQLTEVVRAGIGQSWEAKSPTLTAYLETKARRDQAQQSFRDAYNKFVKFTIPSRKDRVPKVETYERRYFDALNKKNELDSQLVKAVKQLSALRLGVRNAANRLNDAFIAIQNVSGVQFGEQLQQLRNNLLAAEGIRAETMKRSVVRQAQATEMARRERAVAEPLRVMRQQTEGALREAQERAEARRAPAPEETQAEREARDAEQRREEQGRLERGEAMPRTIVQFEKENDVSLADNEYVRLVEAVYNPKLTSEQRMAAAKEADAYLEQKIQKQNAQAARGQALLDMHGKNLKLAETKLAQMREARANVKLTTRQAAKAKTQEEIDAILDAKRADIDKQITKQSALVAKHRKNLTAASGMGRVIRTMPSELREYREALNREIAGTRVEGERLGPRAIGPVTRDEVTPPKTMRTGSEESRAGETTTDARSRLTEARGLRQRDIPMTAKEMADAEAQAAAMKTLEGVEKAEAALAKQFKEAQERGFRPGERDRLTERQAILTARKNALRDPRTGKPLAKQIEEVAPVETEVEAAETAETAETAEKAPKETKKVKTAKKRAERKASAVEGMEEGLDSFEVEIRPGENQEVFFSRGATPNPSTIDSVRAELKQAFPDLNRVQIYDSVDALVAANPQYKGKIPSDARGFVDTAGNKAFLIAENINQGQAMSVLLHEVGAHVGLRNLLGAGQYDTLVNAVKSWEKRNDGSKESQVAQAARARVEAAETPPGQVNDELLAYAIEEAVNAGVKPTETKGVLGRWLSQVAALFRRALEKFGLPPKALDAQGIVDMAFGAAKMEMGREAAAPETAAPEAGEILFSRNLPTASRVADAIVAKQPGIREKIKDNLLGFRAQFIDKLDPVEEVLKRGKVDSLKATQAMYNLRMYDQRMHFTSLAITDGAPELVEKTRKDGRTERLIEAKPGANIKQIADILKKKDVVKAAGSADGANRLFTLYLAALRAKTVGLDALNFGGKVTQADLDAALAEIDADPTLKDAFREARDLYNQYNRNLISFAVQTGAIGKDQGARLLASNDYVPYYRMRDGVAQLIIGKETPIRIGNLKDSPHLQELVGGDEAIFDFLTSSVQNTSMLLDMSMHNLAVRNLMFELRDVGLAKISKTPKSGAPTGSVTFKKDGEEYFAVVDTDALGVSSELLVKGLAGIPTMFPAVVRVLGVPSRLLRRVVVASPVYMGRQLVRDSTAAAIASGADIMPVLGALKQIGQTKALERRGITGGQVFTGMPEDQTRILKDMQAGKLSLTNGLSWLEAKSAQVDALTREAQYKSYKEQGLSDMEATMLSLESMNFSRRGLSPTMHMLSTLIPFFNAQIQGLDVLYRSFTGQMPMNERVKIREKLWTRGMMLFGLSMIYAASMDEEDKFYKNAKPEEKYGNWFVPIPGMEQPLRVPIPFELGYIFKALPEALVNTMRSEEGGEEALKALKHIAVQTVPGLSSFFLPQAVKPALEVAFGTSMYTGRAIESAKEQMLEPGFRSRETTTELARMVGEATGFSPIKMEYLIRGYTGSMGMAALAMLSAPFGRTGPEPATKRPSDLPVVGTLFQPTDASGIIDATYERMNKVRKIQDTYEDLLNKGRVQDADAYLKENADQMALASVAGSFRQQMGEITQFERAVRMSKMTPDQKREALDRARQAKITLASSVQEMVGKKERQAASA